MDSIRITHKKKYAPVPKHGQNLELRRKLEQTLENGPYSTTLLSDELYKDHTQKKIMPPYQKVHRQNSAAAFMSEHLKTQQEANLEQLIHFWACLWYIMDSIRSPHKKNMPPYQKVHRQISGAEFMRLRVYKVTTQKKYAPRTKKFTVKFQAPNLWD